MEINNTAKTILKEINEKINSHVFLIETNNKDLCLNDIKRLVKKLVSRNDELVDKQIDNETYLEQIIIRSEGKEILKDQIIELQERLKIKPTLSDNLVYIILDTEKLNDNSSNKLLKTIEEPPEGVIGFLITNNIDLILPTIKSRCEILSMNYQINYDSSKDIEEIRETAEKIIECVETKNILKLNTLKLNLNIDRDRSKKIVDIIRKYYNMATKINNYEHLNIKIVENICNNNGYDVLIKKATYLNKFCNKLTFNMNAGLLLEKMYIELGEIK